MVKKKYTPKQGDIVFLDFNPQKVHEQKGERPALVVSSDLFNKKTGFALVCPISSKNNKFPLHIVLPDEVSTTGYVLAEHVKSIDLSARDMYFLECVPNDFLNHLTAILTSFYNYDDV